MCNARCNTRARRAMECSRVDTANGTAYGTREEMQEAQHQVCRESGVRSPSSYQSMHSFSGTRKKRGRESSQCASPFNCSPRTSTVLYRLSHLAKMLDKIGLVCITIVGFQIIRVLIKFVYDHIIAPNFGLSNVDFKNMGKWAVVTGSTDGIGKAYAEALAKKGLSIVLISRNQTKLNAVAHNIQNDHKVETKTIAVDFSSSPDIYYEIEKQLTGMEIGVLVNNVGMSYPYPEYFLEQPNKDKLYPNLINVNIFSVTNMTKLVLPGMLERKRGVIINISSMAAMIPNPFVTVYAATKAFVNKFTEDLSTEYSKCGIIFQTVCPGYVVTNMSKLSTATWMSPSPKTYVHSALKTVGTQNVTTGYFPHALMKKTLNTIESVSPKLCRWFISRIMLNIRARALRKLENRETVCTIGYPTVG